LTGEAKRQRYIISHLASEGDSITRTRTAIAQHIAEKNGIIWKNIYSGVFRDLDEVLIPLNVVIEDGRLPLTRGPKALQEAGVPFYKLTIKGLLVALGLAELKDKDGVLQQFLSKSEIKENYFKESIKILAKISPSFAYSIFEKYIRAYCDGKVKDIIPFNIIELKKISDQTFKIQKELLEGFTALSKSDKNVVLNMFMEK
jgi:hypothetical protein